MSKEKEASLLSAILPEDFEIKVVEHHLNSHDIFLE